MRTMKRKQPKQPERNTVKKEGLTETLNVKTILLSLLMLLLPPGELFLFYFMKDTDTGSFLTGFITLGMLLLVFVFVFLTGLYQKTFLYNNGAHPERLLGVYVLGLLLVSSMSHKNCETRYRLSRQHRQPSRKILLFFHLRAKKGSPLLESRTTFVLVLCTMGFNLK